MSENAQRLVVDFRELSEADIESVKQMAVALQFKLAEVANEGNPHPDVFKRRLELTPFVLFMALEAAQAGAASVAAMDDQ